MQIEAPKIRTALALWADDLGLELSQLDADMLIDRIRALSTVTPAEVGGLVEKLRQCADDPMWADHAEVPKRWLSEAATALEAQAAELATMKQDFETLAELQKAAFQRAERAEAALAEARKVMKEAIAHIVGLYDGIAPHARYENELTINGRVNGNRHADNDPVVRELRAALKAAMEAGR